MKTATKLLRQNTVSQNIISKNWVLSVALAKFPTRLVVLSGFVLISALSMVHVTHQVRSLNASLQQTFAERDRMHVEWSQLLLERSTWLMQARIQQVAADKMDMVVPENKDIKIIK